MSKYYDRKYIFLNLVFSNIMLIRARARSIYIGMPKRPLPQAAPTSGGPFPSMATAPPGHRPAVIGPAVLSSLVPWPHR